MGPRSRRFFLIPALLLAATCFAREQARNDMDALTASPENFRLLLENEHVRVMEYVLLPGKQDTWHTHPPKVSYVLSGGTLEVHLDDGTSFLADEKSGTASWAEVRGKHYVKNVGTTPVKILLVEDKAAAEKGVSTSSSTK